MEPKQKKMRPKQVQLPYSQTADSSNRSIPTHFRQTCQADKQNCLGQTLLSN